jgi:hypothetical protein
MLWTNAPAFAWPWVAAIPVAVLVAVAIAAVAALPGASLLGRRLRLAGTVVIASLALTGTLWQALSSGAGNATATTRGERQASSPLPDLQSEIKSLKIRISQLEHDTTMRMIGADTAKKLAAYLNGFGSHSVVVFCTPNDVEAYDYATQLADVLRSAGWDARGPEVTTTFGDVEAMGVNVYDDEASTDDTVKILLAGLAKFSIPFQVRVTPPQAAEGAAVALLVGAQPVRQTAAAAERSAP